MDSSTHDELLEQLIALVHRGDEEGLQQLCLENRGQIEREFRGWKTVPPAWREDRDSLDRYVAGLLGIARFFADGLGRPELLDHLMGRDRSEGDASPLERWHEGLESAQTSLDEGRHRDAATLLQNIVDETDGVRGSWVDEYLPVTLGMLGGAYFNAGLVERASDPTSRALAMCRETGDEDGIVAYLTNLHEIRRYLGESEDAATLARALAERLESSDPNRAQRMQTRARIIEEGEPSLRVVVLPPDGSGPYELDQLDLLAPLEQGADSLLGGLRFAFERNRVTLGGCAHKLETGREFATHGRLAEAVASFEEAAQLDPWAPDPPYLRGLALAELGRFDEALLAYDRVEELAPGWHRVAEDRALVAAIAAGELESDALNIVREIEDGPRMPRAKIAVAHGALERFPALARLHFALGRAHWSVDEHEEARAAWRTALETADNASIRTRALAELGATALDSDEGVRDLHGAIEEDGELVASAMARVLLYLRPKATH
ncbi:MAG: tetratricopeptide repeat protein [Nannocystaceae bacterium]|nr:tetratricopeptide repeat protein [bacterium]